MKYEYDDIGRLKLPPKLAREYIDLIKVKYSLATGRYKKNPDGNLSGIRVALHEASTHSYRGSAEYLLASDNRERAIAAVKGPSATFKQEALELWLSVIQSMSDLEKVMLGWDKV